MAISAINPATGETVREQVENTAEEARALVESSHEAFLAWRRTTLGARAEHLTDTARLLRDRTHRYADLMAEEMGKPVTQGRAEIEKCAAVCDYYAEHGAGFLSARTVETEARESYVAYRPLGVLLAIMPWNFPFWQVFRFTAPNLFSGNTALLKHASNVPGCSAAIEEILGEAGYPEGVFRSIYLSNDEVAPLIGHPLIRGVALTGSVGAGRAVGGAAGSAITPSVLELGGSDAYLVFEDADLERAIDLCVQSRLINSGQSCIAAKRFIVEKGVHDRFVDGMVERMRQVRMGDPADPETELGPLARTDLRDALHQQVRKSVDGGARCVLGGEIPAGPGAFYPPTVLTNVGPGMPAYEEELFGPVAGVIRSRSERESIEIANGTRFGLGAAVFTSDLDRARRIAEVELDAGACFVNDLVRSDPRLPFGGTKESGYGRELAREGILEFLNQKTVYVA